MWIVTFGVSRLSVCPDTLEGVNIETQARSQVRIWGSAFWKKVDFLACFWEKMDDWTFYRALLEIVDFFVCFFGRKWTFLCTSWEKMDSLKSLLHAFSVKVDFFLAKYAQNCGHVKNTEKIQQNYAQIKMYFVTVKIFSEV